MGIGGIASLVTALAKSKLGRLVLIPVVILAGAFSWLSIADGTQNAQDRARLTGWWGWLSPAMEPQWQRLADPASPDYGSAYHSLKNIGSEWAKTDQQRAFKALAFVLVVSAVLAAVVAGGAALALGVVL